MEPRRPDTINGYEHPTSFSYSKQRMYKTFTEGEKAKRMEDFGTTTVGKQYASNIEQPLEETETCPLCDSPTEYICPCGYNDKKCQKGHMWYTDREGKIKKGNPHMK